MSRDLSFNKVLKKFELSLRSDRTPEAVQYLMMLSEKASTEREEEIVQELHELIGAGDEDALEDFFETVYAEASA